MAKKRQPTAAASKDDEPLTPASKKDQPHTSAKKNNPPPPSKKPEEEKVEEKDNEDSTSEEASSSEGEEEDEESEEEEQPPSSQPASKTAQTEKSESNDEDEEESDTDSDQEPPHKLKSIDQTPKSKSQPKSSSAPAISGTKRSVENHADETKKSKKKKTTEEHEEDNKKPGDDSKRLFQRVFNEDDELSILKGLVDFTLKTGTDPVKYFPAFYEDVKKFIHFPVTLEQLKDKVRRMKLKFENKLKSCKNGKTPVFSKPIEEKMFEFGKKIWGGNVVEENGKKKLEMEPGLSFVVFKETRKESVSNVFGSGMDLLKSGAELLEESKRIEFEKRWKDLQIDELKVFKMRAELAEEQGRFILDALMSSSSD